VLELAFARAASVGLVDDRKGRGGHAPRALLRPGCVVAMAWRMSRGGGKRTARGFVHAAAAVGAAGRDQRRTVGGCTQQTHSQKK